MVYMFRVGIVVLVAISLIVLPYSIYGQTEKTLERFNGERTVESPYITYEGFEDISIDGRGRMGELLTVASVDQAVHILGEPRDRKITQINSGGYKKITELLYDGLNVSYLEAAGNIYLKEVEITSSDHFLEVGGKKVRPGMRQSKLGTPLRKDLRQAKSKGTDSGPHTTIFIERKGGKKSKGGERVLEYSEIRIEEDPDSGGIKLVRFSRVI